MTGSSCLRRLILTSLVEIESVVCEASGEFVMILAMSVSEMDVKHYSVQSLKSSAASLNKTIKTQCFVISRPELKIRREVLDWSAYHAAAAAPHLWPNISVAIDPRLSK